MPVVDEFVLRTLKLCERVPVKRLGKYFGFTAAETETVVTELVARGLIVVDDNAACLHESAHEHFRGTTDGSPRIMEIETWIERLWFDLVSHNMMTPQRLRATRNLIEIKPGNLARDLPISFARRAFEENFSEYLRKVRRINNPDRFGLYSISDVEAGRFGYVVLSGREELVLDPEPQLRPHLLDVDVEDIARFRPLSDAMTDAYRRLRFASPSAAGLSDYQRLTADSTIPSHYSADGLFRVTDWLASPQTNSNPERHPIIGASYIDRNIEAFTRLLETVALPRIKNAPPRKLDLLWFRPIGSGWGATSDVQNAIGNLRGVLRRSLPNGGVMTTSLITPKTASRESEQGFRQVFDRGYVSQSRPISPAVEVVLLRGIGAMVLFRVSLSNTVSVPVGFAIVDPKGIGRIEKGLHWERHDRFERLWARPKRDEGQDENVIDSSA